MQMFIFTIFENKIKLFFDIVFRRKIGNIVPDFYRKVRLFSVLASVQIIFFCFLQHT